MKSDTDRESGSHSDAVGLMLPAAKKNEEREFCVAQKERNAYEDGAG